MEAMYDKIDDLYSQIKELYSDRIVVLRDMENDPDIEIGGDEIADKYGEQLNKIDDKISELNNKITTIQTKIKHINKLFNT